VVALLDRVDSAAATGNPAQAAAELERALRISPRDGELWLRLARVRMQQKQWQQAEAVALKCISLPESKAITKQAAWHVIGSAREARGDAAGSAVARRRAAAIIIP
jgi:tetratricopeptide (TPR) repeat protein